MHAITSSSRKMVSATIKITGFQPTIASFLNDVLMPSAAIAVTKHQPDILVSTSVATGGIQPMLLISTSTTNATKKLGNAQAVQLKWI